jgi:SAM-dependent methyltransferase
MADESMVRNLAAQAEAIWPQEEPIFDRHPIGTGAVLDVGCGTGEITSRLAAKYPKATFVGIDLEETHLERARAKSKAFGSRVRFQTGDALNMPFGDEQFDLVVCRHVIQAVPDAAQVLREIRRVLRPGGRAHVIAEDYGMLWAEPTPGNSDQFWQIIPWKCEVGFGCDLHIGRKMFTLLTDLKMNDIRADYIVVDTLRVPRETFARIWEAWRDGYSDSIVQFGGVTREDNDRVWSELLGAVRDPRGYALWQLPLWTCAKP